MADERRAESLALGLLCAWLLVYWILQYHPFVLPNNDYYSFERTARSFAAGELPRDFKRMPVFPALMALATPSMPDPHPALHAALVLNLGFSLGLLVLVQRMASRTIGRGAILVPVLLATSPQFHSMALQPLVEPSLGFFVALAFVLFQARSDWQYAALFAAALGRYEVATLIPILFAVNVWYGGSPRRHLGLAALASSGLVAWTLLGAAAGSGGGSYVELMKGMGWTPAPGFLGRVVEEPFAGLHPLRTLGAPVYALAIGVPALAGAGFALREFRREAVAMLGFLGVTTAVIVVFGIDKARYVYPGQWISLLLWVLGTLRLVEWVLRRLAPRLAPPAPALLLAAAACAWGAALAFGLVYLRGRPHVAPLGLDLAHAAIAVCLACVPFWPGSRAPRTLWLALACAALTPLTFLTVGGVARKASALFEVHYANYGSYVLADWLRANLAPDERVVVLHKSHILHLTDFERSRVATYGQLGGGTPEELAAAMRARGLTHAAYTWRGPVRNPAQAYYADKKNVALAEHFLAGGSVPGFRHVATLPVPEQLEMAPVQVYRLVP